MHILATLNIANKGFRGIRRYVARLKFSCILIGNRPQSLTGHIVKRFDKLNTTQLDNEKRTFRHV